MKGLSLPGGFVVKSQIDKGSYGKIFECEDTNNQNRDLVVKFSDEY